MTCSNRRPGSRDCSLYYRDLQNRLLARQRSQTYHNLAPIPKHSHAYHGDQKHFAQTNLHWFSSSRILFKISLLNAAFAFFPIQRCNSVLNLSK